MKRILLISLMVMGCMTLFGQQTGTIIGKVTTANGELLPGVVVLAESTVMPQPRSAVTDDLGQFRFPLLTPERYQMTFNMPGMQTVKTTAVVLLQQTTTLNIEMQPQTNEESMVVAAQLPLIDPTSAELKTAIGQEVIDKLPIGQEYQDLVKLIPGVQYTEDTVRGPSAGGSGQDNVYLFDGVNVTLPLFGTLSAEPSSHDIDQISVIKGGAKAIDFNRSGGFTINSISRSGTNNYQGEISYQFQDNSWVADRDTTSAAEFDQDEAWLVANVGGPLIKDRLHFYASYYGPTEDRQNGSNLYGDVPDFKSDRDEIFFKLTFSPIENLTLHASYRDSQHDVNASGVLGEATAGTASTGTTTELEIGILEGNWILNSNSSVSFKYSDFSNKNSSRPDTLFNFFAAIDGSRNLDINALDQQGFFAVPTSRAGNDIYNNFAAPLIQRYGYMENGQLVGGGRVGGAAQIDDQDFFRESIQVGYDYFLQVGDWSHDLHFGYQNYTDEEDLQRSSNGWGTISVVANLDPANPDRFFQARFNQGSLEASLGAGVTLVHSEFKSQNIEINDTFTRGDWTFNAGVLISNDELIGQGLEEDSSRPSGFRVNPSSKYTMYEVDWADQIQPRLGAIWNFTDSGTIYANYARYNPAASSLPRAASWARNLVGGIVDAFFDAQGNFLTATAVQSSSGKFFQPDMNPRSTDEYVLGISEQLSHGWTGKFFFRHRYSHNFWEDTNNNARAAFGNTDEIRAQPDYIPELATYRADVGGSSYVIAELDNSYSKYYAADFDLEWRGEKAYFKGSYVWSHYYGNVDQDNTTVENDQNIFIGSSNLADGAGRQLWDLKEGNLRGDRRHLFKLFGYYQLPWQATAGAFVIYQSGQPWETWDVEVYRSLTTSSSDTIRFSEPAGSRRTSSHYQADLNYTQNFNISGRFNFQAKLDIYNISDNQTGYNVQPSIHSSSYGESRSFYNPRRYQLLVKFQF